MGGNTGKYSKTTIKQHPNTQLPNKKTNKKFPFIFKSKELYFNCNSNHTWPKRKKIHKEEMEGMKK